VSTYNRVVAADENASLAPAVRARLATEMADGTSEVGAALAGAFATPASVAGKELGYSELVAGGIIGTTSNRGVLVTGVSATVNIETRPVVVYFRGLCDTSSGVAAVIYLDLYEDGAKVARWGSAGDGTAAHFVGITGAARRAPAAGSHTYTMKVVSANNTSTVRLWHGVIYPASIQVVEL